jgi:hypothetical protein
MAKRRRKSRSYKKQTTKRTNRRLRSFSHLSVSVPRRAVKSPQSSPARRTVVTRAHQSVTGTRKTRRRKNKTSLLTHKQTYKTLVCAKRHTRKQVMFATNKAGKAGQRKQRITPERNIKCGKR